MKLCSKYLHSVEDHNNIRYDKRGVAICKPCDTEYQKNKSSDLSSLPPTTEAIINGYKEPLRSNEGGFGYLGTIAYDKTEQYTQCHTCGYFYKHLGKHIRQSHDMSSDEYKETYQLEKQTSLFATNTRTKYIQKWIDLSDEERQEVVQRLKKARKNRLPEGSGRTHHRLEYYNKRGSCPDQIIDKILKLYDETKQVPTLKQFEKRWGGRHYGKSAQLHFGTWQEAVKQAGLTPQKRCGKTWYTDEQLLESLVAFRNTNGREPYYSEARTGILLAGGTTYRDRFGSWSRAKMLAFEE